MQADLKVINVVVSFTKIIIRYLTLMVIKLICKTITNQATTTILVNKLETILKPQVTSFKGYDLIFFSCCFQCPLLPIKKGCNQAWSLNGTKTFCYLYIFILWSDWSRKLNLIQESTTRRVLDECFSSAKSEVDDITFLAMWFQKIQVVILLQIVMVSPGTYWVKTHESLY